MISRLIDATEADLVLDYGCGGEHELADILTPERDFRYQAYDATVPALAGDPVPSDMVVCIETLSDLHPWQVDEALDKIENLTEHIFFCSVKTSVMPLNWWLPRIMDRFDIQSVQVIGPESACIVALRPGWYYPKIC